MDQVISFALTLIDGLISLIEMIPQAVSLLITLIGVMPPFLVGVLTAAVGLLVTFTLVGRGK